MMETSNCSIPELNEYVLYEIFKHLPLRDRKNVRLVCRSWRQVCGRQKFTETEMFFISRYYDISSVLQVLENVQNETMNLKFDSREFDESLDILWKTCGSKIRSLQFYGCEVYSEILRKSFEFCENLTEFCTLKGCAGRWTRFERSNHKCFSHIFHNLDKFPVSGSLSTLHLESMVDNRGLFCIATSFPHLKSLEIRLKMNDDENSSVPTHFYTLLDLLPTSLHQIRRLGVKFIPYHGDSNAKSLSLDFARVESDLSNLNQSMSMSITVPAASLQEMNLNTSLCFKFWTKLKILNSPRLEGPYLRVLVRILDENPQLEELSFPLTNVNLSAMVNILRALVESNLTFLNINVTGVCLFRLNDFISEILTSSRPLTLNNSVHSLKIAGSNTVCASIFLKYFVNIRHLRVRTLNVKDAFEFQVNLHALNIQLVGRSLKFDRHEGFAQPRQLIRTLEFLRIDSYRLNELFNYAFPELKYFIYSTDSPSPYLRRRRPTVVDRDVIRDLEGTSYVLSLPSTPNLYGTNSNSIPSEIVRWSSGTDEESLNLAEDPWDEINDFMSHLQKNSPHLTGIAINCSLEKIQMEAFIAFFKSCLHFQQLRYIWLTFGSTDVEKTDLMREMDEHLSQSSSLRSAWVDNLQVYAYQIHFFRNIVTKKFEFQDVYSFFNPFDVDYLVKIFFKCCHESGIRCNYS